MYRGLESAYAPDYNPIHLRGQTVASGFTTNKIVGDCDSALPVNSSTILDYIGQASSKLCVNGILTPDSFICIPSQWYSVLIKGLVKLIGDNVMCYPDLHYAIATGGVPKIYGLNVIDSPMYEIESDTVNVLYGSPGAIGNVAHIWRDESSVGELVCFLRYGARIMNEAHGGYIKLRRVADDT